MFLCYEFFISIFEKGARAGDKKRQETISVFDVIVHGKLYDVILVPRSHRPLPSQLMDDRVVVFVLGMDVFMLLSTFIQHLWLLSDQGLVKRLHFHVH